MKELESTPTIILHVPQQTKAYFVEQISHLCE